MFLSQSKKIKNNVFLSLGSNMGNKEKNITEAIKKLQYIPNINLLKISSFYITKPVGYNNQDDFINCCLQLTTHLSPYKLLEKTQEIENQFHRKRDIRFGPRTLDIDILLFNNLTLLNKQLTIPHQSMFKRAFVLVPLLEIMTEDNFYFENVKQSLTKIGYDGVLKYTIVEAHF